MPFCSALNRFDEPEESGAICDMLWSDPHENYDEVRELDTVLGAVYWMAYRGTP